jgi:3-isopropylmalate/(R)-2-methylmalate dehydratase large subunit
MTLTEKIIARAAGVSAVTPGDEVWADVDLVMMNDTSGPRRMAPKLEQLGGQVWDISKVVLATDHFIPAANQRHTDILDRTRHWAEEHRLPHFFDFQGVLHNLVLEKFLALPGMLIAGADSHSVTAGAVGAVAVGISSTELATILATGQIWLRVPATVRITLNGAFSPGVTVRDLAMRILAELGADFGLGHAVEFAGPALASMALEDRSVLSNQSIEMGAENGIVIPDEHLLGEMTVAGVEFSGPLPTSDPDAEIAANHTFEVAGVEPQVACPHAVDNVRDVSEAAGTEIDRVYIGSCVGGRLSDLMMAAEVLGGRRVAVPTLVTPATQQIYQASLENGTLKTLTAAGVIVQAPGCGACAGLLGGVLGPGERCMSTVTRNFRGRMGAPSAEVYLASPYTAAATAVAGHIIDPRRYV